MLKISPEKGFKTELQAPTAVLVTRRVTFAAAHVLRRPEWDDRRNKEVFGQCAGDHGHNYVLEVSVSGVPDPATGMVVNLKDLDRAVKQAVRLHNLLAALRDGVLLTDRKGRVSFLNPAARSLLGPEDANAARQPLAKVLRLVEEESRWPVRDLVARILNAAAEPPSTSISSMCNTAVLSLSFFFSSSGRAYT